MKGPRRFEKKRGVQVKICGITTPDDARMAADEGAAAIGLNFYPASKRFVNLRNAEKIVEFAESELLRIGVTVNAEFDILSSIWESGVVDMFQFHGTESPEYLQIAAQKGWPFFVAKRVKTRAEAAAAIDDASSNPISTILLDSHVPGEMGGTGQKIEWKLLTDLFTHYENMTCILAGGLESENVREAICLTRPHVVDVASGVEESPGRKSRERVKSFLREVQRTGNIR